MLCAGIRNITGIQGTIVDNKKDILLEKAVQCNTCDFEIC